MSNDLPLIPLTRVVVGLYVHLDVNWLNHPFPSNQFIIKSQDQIDKLRSLDITDIRYDPSRSTTEPRLLSVAAPVAVATIDPILEAKRVGIAELKKSREAIKECEKNYASAAKTVGDIAKNLLARPRETIEQASVLIGNMASSLLAEKELMMHLMNDKVAGEDVYFHSLNVAILAMMLGRECGFASQDIEILGLGGLFHDIGKTKIPHKVLIKVDNPNTAEAGLLKQHCRYGSEIAEKVNLTQPVTILIQQHHEAVDGSGYPAGLKGDAINPLARLLAIVNCYDNLCNPHSVANAITPHEALSLMFSRQRSKFDGKMLSVFIKSFGVYPPGTVVQLNDSRVAMVVGVNTSNPLRPSIVIYDETIPREESLATSLAAYPDISIAKAMRPIQLPGPIFAYLSPRARITYFFDASSAATPGKTS